MDENQMKRHKFENSKVWVERLWNLYSPHDHGKSTLQNKDDKIKLKNIFFEAVKCDQIEIAEQFLKKGILYVDGFVSIFDNEQALSSASRNDRFHFMIRLLLRYFGLWRYATSVVYLHKKPIVIDFTGLLQQLFETCDQTEPLKKEQVDQLTEQAVTIFFSVDSEIERRDAELVPISLMWRILDEEKRLRLKCQGDPKCIFEEFKKFDVCYRALKQFGVNKEFESMLFTKNSLDYHSIEGMKEHDLYSLFVGGYESKFGLKKQLQSNSKFIRLYNTYFRYA